MCYAYTPWFKLVCGLGAGPGGATKNKKQSMVVLEQYDCARKDSSQFVAPCSHNVVIKIAVPPSPPARGTVAGMSGEVCLERSGPNRLLIPQPSKMPRQVRDVGGWGSSGPP